MSYEYRDPMRMLGFHIDRAHFKTVTSIDLIISYTAVILLVAIYGIAAALNANNVWVTGAFIAFIGYVIYTNYLRTRANQQMISLLSGVIAEPHEDEKPTPVKAL